MKKNRKKLKNIQIGRGKSAVIIIIIIIIIISLATINIYMKSISVRK